MNFNSTNELLILTQAMAEFNFETSLNFRFMGLLRQKLLHAGLSVENAEMIASQINVELEGLTDEELEQITTDFSKIIMNSIAGFRAQGFEDAIQAVVRSASKMNLKG